MEPHLLQFTRHPQQTLSRTCVTISACLQGMQSPAWQQQLQQQVQQQRQKQPKRRRLRVKKRDPEQGPPRRYRKVTLSAIKDPVPGQGPYWPFTETPLVYFAYSLFKHLPAADQELAKRGQPERINWAKFGRGNSPVAAAIKELDSTFDAVPDPPTGERMWQRPDGTQGMYVAKSNTLRRCFRKYFVDAANLYDAPRGRGEDRMPTLQEMYQVKTILTGLRWVDDWKNKRRHPDIAHFLEVAPEQAQGTQQADMVAALAAAMRECKRRTGLSFSTLEQYCATKFNLRRRCEKFKDARVKADAQLLALMLRGDEGMLEELATHKETERQPNGMPKLPPWHKRIKTDVMRNATQRRQDGNRRRATPLKFGKDAWQITACIDGASVWLTPDKRAPANEVYYEVCTAHEQPALLHAALIGCALCFGHALTLLLHGSLGACCLLQQSSMSWRHRGCWQQ